MIMETLRKVLQKRSAIDVTQDVVVKIEIR